MKVNNIKVNEKLNYQELFLLGLLMIITANASALISDPLILWVTIGSFILFIIKKKKIDAFILVIIFLFILINFISFYFVNNTIFNIRTFIGFVLKMLYPYFFIKIIGKNFFDKLEKIIFILTTISIPIFIIQLIIPNQFYSLSSLLNFVTLDEQKTRGGWYVFFYMFSGWFPNRNSGFMWEPGAFAFMILLGMTITFSKYGGMHFTKRIFVYFIALILTFSTMGYFALFIMLMYYFILTKRIWLIILALPLIYPLISQIINAEFLLPKINFYFDTLGQYSSRQDSNYIKANRFTYFVYVINSLSHWPFGHGIVPDKKMLSTFYTEVKGAGTLSKILIYWGIEGLLFFIWSVYKFFKTININKTPFLNFVLTLILLIGFFSNPLAKSPILFSVVFYPYIFNKKEYVK